MLKTCLVAIAIKDGVMFEEYVHKVDNKSTADGRKVALLFDNYPSHHWVDNLKSIDPVFLPLNTIPKH